jgi:pimeloyl-ACP methyl ester carboxylesterase
MGRGQGVKLDRGALSFRAIAGDRGCLALFHGMLASHHYFSSSIGLRLQPWRLLLPDLLGFGDSSKPPVEFTLADHLDCLADLVSAEGTPEPLVLGGHSLGCLLATALAARLPEGRVAGIVFLNYPRFTSPGLIHSTLRDGSDHYRQATAGMGDVGHEELLAVSGDAVQEFARILPAALQEEARRTSPRSLTGTTRHCLFAYRPDPDLDRLAHLPMLFLLGGRDEVAPASFIREREGHFPRARWVFVEDAGHHLVHTHTELAVREVSSFLAGIGSP